MSVEAAARRRRRRTIARGGNRFSPLQIPGLQLWLDASDTYSVYSDGASQFTAANSEFLSIVDNATLSVGDIDFWVAAWIYPDTLGAHCIISKGNLASTYIPAEYSLEINAAGRALFYAGNNVATSAFAQTAASTVTAGQWNFVFGWHDSVNNTLNVQVNNGTVGSTAFTVGSHDSTFDMNVGKWANYAGGYFNGRIDCLAFGKSPVTGIAAVRSDIATSLYSNGAGKTYDDITAQEKAAWGLVSFWKFNEMSGTRYDAHGTNHLTDNNTVTVATGVAAGRALTSNDPVSLWKDMSGNQRNATQTTYSMRPSMQLSAVNSRNVVRGDGGDDHLVTGAFPLGNTFLVAMVIKVNDTNAMLMEQSVDSLNNDGFWIYDHSVEGNGEGGRINGNTNNIYGDAAAIWAMDNSVHLIELAGDSINTSQLLKDGAVVVSFNGNFGTIASTAAYLLARSGGTFAAAADLCEVIVWSPLPTTAELAAMRTHIRTKWGTP